jgi:hypothetical protein
VPGSEASLHRRRRGGENIVDLQPPPGAVAKVLLVREPALARTGVGQLAPPDVADDDDLDVIDDHDVDHHPEFDDHDVIDDDDTTAHGLRRFCAADRATQWHVEVHVGRRVQRELARHNEMAAAAHRDERLQHRHTTQSGLLCQ